MSLFLKKEWKEGVLGIWHMDESWEELCASLHDQNLGQEAIRRFKATHRRMEWIAVRRLIQEILPYPVTIGYYPSGKPYLIDSPLHISISHTLEYVAVILHPQPVGLDIEQYGQQVHRITSRFIRKDEVINSFSGEDTWSLLLHWSAKETMFKYLDMENVDLINQLHVFPFTPQTEGSFSAQETKTEQKRIFNIQYLLCKDFVLTYTI